MGRFVVYCCAHEENRNRLYNGNEKHSRMKNANLFLSVLLVCFVPVFSVFGQTPEKPHFKLMPFNTEGTTYMKAALCSSAVVGDFDGDGDDDVYLTAGGGTDMKGAWFFENVTPAGAKSAPTAFKPRTRRGHCGEFGIRCELADGTFAVVSQNSVNYDFLKDPTAFKPLAPNLPVNLHFGNVRANYWRLKDFDGDGHDDIIVGVGDWREYAWGDRYEPNGA